MFRVAKIELGEAGARLTWNAKRAKVYEVEFSESLQPNSWAVVASNLAGEGALTWTAPPAPGKARGWYRLRVKG